MVHLSPYIQATPEQPVPVNASKRKTGVLVTPFTVLIDSQEQHPFSFQGLMADADQHYRPLLVKVETEYLGIAQGDYQLKECRGLASIERKSLPDFHGTVLGWGERRERFKRELETLNAMQLGIVICEATFGEVLSQAPDWGKKTPEQNRKILFRSVLAWQQEFRNVQWMFCDTRQLAEVTAFRALERFYETKISEAQA